MSLLARKERACTQYKPLAVQVNMDRNSHPDAASTAWTVESASAGPSTHLLLDTNVRPARFGRLRVLFCAYAHVEQ